MVEVRLLQHFAQVAGANLGGKRLLLVIVEIGLLGLVAAMMRSGLKFLALDHLFFDVSGAGRIG